MSVMLKRSKDRKVTNKVTPSGGVSIANTMGLPPGKSWSCPSATLYCESICYVMPLQKVYKGVRGVLVHNWELLRSATFTEQVELLTAMIAEFDAECVRREAPPLFRIHWSGDFFSDQYTGAWSYVISQFPHIQFWVYTRSADAAMILHLGKHSNLSLYYSGDEDNVDSCIDMDRLGIKIAFVGRTFEESDKYMAEITEARAIKCPEIRGSLPLISPKGSACFRCGLCVNERQHVTFSASGR